MFFFSLLSIVASEKCTKTAELAIRRAFGIEASAFIQSEQLQRLGKGGGGDPAPPPPPPPPCGTRDGNIRTDCQQQRYDQLTGSIYPLFLGVYRATQDDTGDYLDAVADAKATSFAAKQLNSQFYGDAGTPGGLQQQVMMLIQSAELLLKYGKTAQSAIANISTAYQGVSDSGISKLQSGLASLVKKANSDISKASNLQNQNAQLNKALAVRVGQRAVDSIAAAMTESQQKISSNVKVSSSSLTTSTSKAQVDISALQHSFDLISSRIDSSPTKLQSSVDSHVQAVSSQMSSTQGNLMDAWQQANSQTTAQLEAAIASFSSYSEQETSSATNAWFDATYSTERKVASEMTAAQSSVSNRESGFQSTVSGQTAGFYQTFQSSQSRVVTSHSAVTASHATLLNNSRTITTDLNTLSDAAADAVADANDASAAQASAVKQLLAKLLGSSSTMSAQQLSYLLTAVSTVQRSSQTKIADSQSQFSNVVSSLYNTMGTDSADKATSVTGSRTALWSSTDQVNANLQTQASREMMLGGQTAESNLKMLYSLGTLARSTSQNALQQAKDAALAKSKAIKSQFNTLRQSSGTASNQLQRKAYSAQLTSASNGKSVTGSLGRAGYSASQMGSAMSSLLGSLNVHSAVLKQSNQNAASQEARIGSSISSNDAKVANQLQTFVDNAQYQQNSASQRTLATSAANFNSLYKAADKGLQFVDTTNRKNTVDARNGQASISQKLAGVSGLTRVLDMGIDQLSKESSETAISINTTFSSKLTQQSRVANEARSSYSSGAYQQMSGVNEWLMHLLGSNLANIQSDAGKGLTKQQGLLSSALNGHENLQSILAGLSTGINQLNELSATQIYPLGQVSKDVSGSMYDHSLLVSRKILDLLAKYKDMQMQAGLLLSNLTSNMQSSMKLIPGLLQRVAGGAMTQLSSMDFKIQERIRKLQAAIAESKDAAVQASAQSAVKVLYRLQAVTAEVVAANDGLLSQIADGKKVDLAQLHDLEESAQTIVDSVAAMDKRTRAKVEDVGSSTEDVGRLVAILFHGLSQQINQTALDLSSNSSAAQVDGKFKLAMAKSRNRKKFNGTKAALGAISSIISQHSSGLTASQGDSRSALQRLALHVDELDRYIDENIARLRNDLMRANASFGATIGEFDYKSLSQEILVKSTLQSLLSLWDEFAGLSIEKFDGFRSRSLDYLGLLDIQLKRAVTKAEKRLEAVGSRLHAINNKMESLEGAEEEFESTMSNLTIALADRERKLNAQVNTLVVDVREAILWYEGNATMDNQKLRNQVKGSLDSLDDEVTRRLKEADAA